MRADGEELPDAPFEHGFKLGIAVVVGAVLVIVGFLLIVTELLWFVGVFLVLLSGVPIAIVSIRDVERKVRSQWLD